MYLCCKIPRISCHKLLCLMRTDVGNDNSGQSKSMEDFTPYFFFKVYCFGERGGPKILFELYFYFL